jgi:hypothetical protein
MRMRVLLCAVALLLGIGGGFLVGSTRAPSQEDAAEVRAEAEAQSFKQARAEAFKTGLISGASDGSAEGKKQGLRRGEEKGIADGEEAVTARDAEAAEAAAEEALVYCPLGFPNYATAADCAQREATEGYCGGPDSPEC